MNTLKRLTDEEHARGPRNIRGKIFDVEWEDDNARRGREAMRRLQFTPVGWFLLASVCACVGFLIYTEITLPNPVIGGMLRDLATYVQKDLRQKAKELHLMPAATPEPASVPEARDGNSNV